MTVQRATTKRSLLLPLLPPPSSQRLLPTYVETVSTYVDLRQPPPPLMDRGPLLASRTGIKFIFHLILSFRKVFILYCLAENMKRCRYCHQNSLPTPPSDQPSPHALTHTQVAVFLASTHTLSIPLSPRRIEKNLHRMKINPNFCLPKY